VPFRYLIPSTVDAYVDIFVGTIDDENRPTTYTTVVFSQIRVLISLIMYLLRWHRLSKCYAEGVILRIRYIVSYLIGFRLRILVFFPSVSYGGWVKT
jgi:hypothetical protein